MVKAAICVQGSRSETYSDAAAAIIKDFPHVREITFLFFGEDPTESLLKNIDEDLHRNSHIQPYVNASRISRTSRSVYSFTRDSLKEYDIIDVTGISKELMSDIFAISLSSGKSLCFISWKEKIDKNKRKFIGQNDYIYFDTMKSSIVRHIHFSQRSAWIMFYVLSIVISLFALFYSFSLFGIELISDKLINFLGILIGLCGLFLSYIALRSSTSQGGRKF